MFEILTVCTGNICRSPVAEQLLRARLAPWGAVVTSAGTRGLASWAMTPEAQRVAASLGIAPEESAAHRSRYLTEQLLVSPALIFAMARDHRRAIAELAPARLRSTFTVREFARISATLPDAELRAAADAAGTDAATRVRALGLAVAAHRGVARAPADPADDDVVDPYGRSWETYERSAEELVPAVEEVARTVGVVLAP